MICPFWGHLILSSWLFATTITCVKKMKCLHTRWTWTNLQQQAIHFFFTGPVGTSFLLTCNLSDLDINDYSWEPQAAPLIIKKLRKIFKKSNICNEVPFSRMAISLVSFRLAFLISTYGFHGAQILNLIQRKRAFQAFSRPKFQFFLLCWEWNGLTCASFATNDLVAW